MRPCSILLLACLLAACGSEEDPQPRAEGAAGTLPSTPAAALAWVKEAADDEPVLRKRLAAWTLDAADFEEAEETQVVMTWRLRLALQDGDVETALRRQHVLEDVFDGEGLSPEGRVLPPDVVIGAIFDEALYQARVRIEGATPDTAGAARALAVAHDTAPADDEHAAKRIRETEAWVGLEDLDDLAKTLKFSLAPSGRPRVVVLAGDFALGEGVFIGVLERWQRDAGEAGARVEIVPVITGQVRMGIRRVPAESRAEELASIRERAEKVGLHLAAEAAEGIRAGRLGRIGLGTQETAIVVANKDGQILARQSGTLIDPRELDTVVERLISR